MKVPLVFVILVFLLNHKVSYASVWSQRYSELDVYLQGYTLESSKVNSIFACYIKCEENILCTSINMNLSEGTCELKCSTKTKHTEKVVTRKNMVYMEIREHVDPISSCKALYSTGVANSGVYWMKLDDQSCQPFQVYCDMETDGGGWTLVYSYNFTNYKNFNGMNNAVDPMPSWPIVRSYNGTYTPVSTTVPLSNISYSAMDFALWKKIGNDFLVTSNINDWFSCLEGTGSLVNWKAGTITCKRVKEVVPRSNYSCTSKIPNELHIGNKCGPQIMAESSLDKKIFKWDSCTSDCVPVHDPCGTKSLRESRHLRRVPNPGGQIYIR